MKRLFGTDGIRAVAGEYPLDKPSIHKLGEALVGLLREEGLSPDVLIGRDTRESGPWMEAALAGGIREAGGHPMSAGVIPTSAVSFITNKHHFNAGVMISASHNPFHDNGIKIFSSVGRKISDAWESRLEDVVIHAKKRGAPKDAEVPPDPAFGAEYAEFLKGALAGVKFPRKLKVALDCANGAASTVAPGVLRELGFEVVAGGCSPDGKNINKGCGSLHPHDLAKIVVKARADIGIAYDGDADRALWVDETGRVLNGDHTLFVLAKFKAGCGRLKTSSVVATGMSNMGLETALGKMGLTLVRTKIGDKYVLEKMIELGANLGGEQSGHTILLDECPTGDGILTGLRMLEAMAAEGRPLSGLVAELREYPQILLNVPVARKEDFRKIPEVAAAMDRVLAGLAGRGRLDVRYSGTEPVARVMVEGEELDAIQYYAHSIADAINHTLGSGA
jgi:phosphoglucosamine mutase